MSTGFVGMDTEQARELAERLRAAAGLVDERRTALGRTIGGVEWRGTDGDAFEHEWTAAAPSFVTLVRLLRSSGDELSRQAEAQDRTSAAEPVVDGHGTAAQPAPASSSPAFCGGPPPKETGLGALIPDKPFAQAAAEAAVNEAEGADLAVRVAGIILGQDWRLDHGPSTAVEVDEPRTVQGSRTPQSLADLIMANDETRRQMNTAPPGKKFHPKDEAQIRIQTVRGADGRERYLVYVPPTQGEKLPESADPREIAQKLRGYDLEGQPFSWPNNIYAMAGRENAGANAVKAAMAKAGIPPGAEVAFVGHSQGGLVAAQLAADPAFNNCSGGSGSYNVTDVFSAGSPVQTYTPAQQSTSVVNINHDSSGDVKGDVVPELDLAGSSPRHVTGNPAPNVTEVRVATPPENPDFPQPGAGHISHDSVHRDKQGNYSTTSGYYGTMIAHADDPAFAAERARLEGRYMGDGATMTDDVVVDARRISAG